MYFRANEESRANCGGFEVRCWNPSGQLSNPLADLSALTALIGPTWFSYFCSQRESDSWNQRPVEGRELEQMEPWRRSRERGLMESLLLSSCTALRQDLDWYVVKSRHGWQTCTCLKSNNFLSKKWKLQAPEMAWVSFPSFFLVQIRSVVFR